LRLTAVFETWHLGDGNYPPLSKGQLVNLSFEIQPRSLRSSSSSKPGKLEQIKDADYHFVGTILKIYDDSPRGKLVVIQAGDFRFYVDSFPPEIPPFKEGDGCEGDGPLLLDHYIWVEFLSSYPDPPDLFYPLRVTRIRSIKIPDEFISRNEKATSGPASLSPENYSAASISEIDEMGIDEDWRFYLVDFDDSNIGSVTIPRTFRSHSQRV